MSKPAQETLLFILESAVMAPSADNQHRICFQLTEDAIRVRYTQGELPQQGGYKRVLALLSLGAVAENLTVAASRFAIKTEITLFPDPAQPDWIMQIHLKSGQAEIDPLWQAIPLRHTNRQVRFSGPKMTDTERDELEAAVHACSSSQLVWLDEPARRSQALRLMRRAETERFRNHVLHEELFTAIHFDVGWRTSCPEGLPPGALGVELPLRGVFALLRHWPIMRLANVLGAHHMLGWRSCDLPCRLAPHLGWWAVKHIDSQSVFEAGRSFQRLWLAATSQGRVLQPMPASALYALDGAPAEGIPAELQRVLAEGWNASLSGAIPLMVFRMGKAKPSSIVAGRRGVENYLEAQYDKRDVSRSLHVDGLPKSGAQTQSGLFSGPP
jgi:hypothetical protein